MKTPSRFFLVAGEHSADHLGAQLMKALKTLLGSDLTFHGVGGERMAAEGLSSLFPIDDIAVMGLFDILPRARTLLARIQATAEHAAAVRPDVAVLIDAPGFNHRMAIRLRRLDPTIPIAIYVAPQVWAWRPKRAFAMRAYCDHVLALLPFEPPFFERAGVRCTHVGHPVVERFPGSGLGAAFRTERGLAPDRPLLVVLPGSRRKEVERLGPVFRGALERLAERFPSLALVVPTVPQVAARVRAEAATWPLPAEVLEDERDKFPAFEAADAAMAASGTVSLELALAGAPTVIAYKVDWITAAYARMAVTVKYANLINLIEDAPVVPELIQENCTPDAVAAAVARLLQDGDERARQRAAFARASAALGLGQDAPSLRAARAVLATPRQPRLAG